MGHEDGGRWPHGLDTLTALPDRHGKQSIAELLDAADELDRQADELEAGGAETEEVLDQALQDLRRAVDVLKQRGATV